MASLANINIRFAVDLKQFSTEMQNSLRTIDKWGQKLQTVGANLSVGVTAPILAFGVASVLAFDQSAQAIAQVDAALKSTGGTVGYNSEQLQKMAADLQSVTTFDDDEILKKATANILTFSNITGTVFQDAQKAALDLATRLDGDLQSASIQVGKALNDPIKGVSALSKVGVSFSVGQKAMIQSMVDTNNLAGAQAIILAELQKEFGGSAEAAAKAGLGGFKQLGNMLGDLSEDFGKIIIEAIQPFLESIKSMVSYLKELTPEAKTTIAVVAGIAAAIGPLTLGIGVVLSMLPTLAAGFAALTGPIGLTVLALTAVAVVIVKNWAPIKQILVDVANYFVDLYNNSTVFRGAIDFVTMAFENMWAVVKLTFNNILATVNFVGNHIYNVFKTAGSLIKSILTFDIDGIKKSLSSGFSQLGSDTVSFFKKLADNGKKTATEVADNIMTALKNTLDGNKIAKIVIPKDKVDASGVAVAVEEAIKNGVSGNRNKKVESVGTIETKGLADVKNPEAKIDASTGIYAVDPAMDTMIKKMQTIREVGQLVSQSVSESFGVLGNSIVDSLGFAANGLQGFASVMLKTLVSLMQMVVKQIVVNQALATSNAIAGATASGLGTGIGAIFTTPAFIATAIAGVIAAFAAIPKFATGGIVSGGSMYGDQILARVNSGEMIANSEQQKRIWGAMNSSSNVNVVLGGGFEIDGNKLRLVLARTDSRNSRTR